MLINCLWYCGMCLGIFAAGRMLTSGLATRLPLVFVYLGIESVYRLALAVTRSEPAIYARIYFGLLPVLMLAKFAASADIYRLLVHNHKNFRMAGCIILGASGTIGALAAWASSGIADFGPPKGSAWIWNAGMVFQRDAAIVIVVMLAAAWLLTSRTEVPLSRTASLAGQVMVADASLGLLSAWATRAYAFQHYALAAYSVAFYGVLAAIGWLCVSPTVEIIPDAPQDRRSELASDFHMLAAVIDDAARRAKRAENSN